MTKPKRISKAAKKRWQTMPRRNRAEVLSFLRHEELTHAAVTAGLDPAWHQQWAADLRAAADYLEAAEPRGSR